MKVDFALLADRAVSRKDGKVDVTGAGVSHVASTDLPAVIPALTLVVRLILEDSDRGTEPTVQFRVSQGDAVVVTSPSQRIHAEATNRVNHEAGEHAALVMISELRQFSFPGYGQFSFDLLIDDVVVASKGLAVIQLASEFRELFGNELGLDISDDSTRDER